MRLSNDFDDRGSGKPVVYMAIAAFLFVVTIFGVVILMNQKNPKGKNSQNIPNMAATSEETDSSAGESASGEEALGNGTGLVSDDLDFWHMYDEDPETGQAEDESDEEEEEETELDPSTDGKHTKLVDEDGTEEWVSINPYLTKNKYDFKGLVYQYPVMKYYEDSKKTSTVGVWVSEEDGDINFGLLKKAGVDFAMIRIGSRGYGSGNVLADTMFYENVRKATEAGMDIGISFYSQAVTEEEAVEEAMRVVEGLQGFTIVYPVAFDMEYVKNDTARVQSLSRDEKTKIATAFMDRVAAYGYKPILYGNKDWLIRKVDLSRLIGYDIWLSQPEEDTPDYPYKFTMWEYTKNAKLNGMEEPASLSICFINYSAK